jgi:2-keto-3-deoxy-L-rhamnonate aldolase RhmA
MGKPLKPGPPRVGLWLAMTDPLVVEAAGRAEPDWVGLDLQHGAWDMGSAFRAIQLLDALQMPVLIRLSELEMHGIPRVLDHGAAGVVVAMASSTEMIEEAVRRARYQPQGERSYGGQRYGMHPEPADVADVRPAVYAMIEDRRGVEQVAAIANVEGIAGLHIGPVDLGLGLGLGLDRDVSQFTNTLDRILDAGHDAGVPVTMHAVAPDQARRWVEMGFDELVLSGDIALLREAFQGGVSVLRGENARGPIGIYGRPDQ